MKDHLEQCLCAGMDGCLAKPLGSDHLDELHCAAGIPRQSGRNRT